MSVNIGTREKHYDIMNISDWFLPSRDELYQMYINLKAEGIGGFSNRNYWSSTEYNAQGAVMYDFTDGTLMSNTGKAGSCYVRPCRSFIGEEDEYVVGDTGPTGGWIFYVETAVKYYEAAPYDMGMYSSWSNITDSAIGTTSTDIGEGYNNTAEIIAQVGHTTSAAKVCNDLIL